MKTSQMNQKTCSVCRASYDAGRSECPECRTPNALFRSATYIKFAIEIEQPLFRAIQEAVKKQRARTVQEFITQAIERELMK